MKILVTLIVFCIVFVSYVRYLEQTSIFYPSSEMLNSPGDIGLDFEDIYFDTSDKVKLHGWFVKSQSAKSTIVFFHGNAGNISERLEKVALFHGLGLNVFIVDYRGYGHSEGKPTEKGMYKDALGAYDYLRSRSDIDKDRIIAYGASLGGVAAIDLATKRKLACLVIDSSFSSAVDMAKRIYPFIPSFLVNIKLDSESKISSIDIPKLFFHSPDDETVPYDLGQKLYKAAKGPKEFIDLEGSHNDGHVASRTVFVGSISRFLKKYNLN